MSYTLHLFALDGQQFGDRMKISAEALVKNVGGRILAEKRCDQCYWPLGTCVPAVYPPIAQLTTSMHCAGWPPPLAPSPSCFGRTWPAAGLP